MLLLIASSKSIHLVLHLVIMTSSSFNICAWQLRIACVHSSPITWVKDFNIKKLQSRTVKTTIKHQCFCPFQFPIEYRDICKEKSYFQTVLI